MIKNKLRVSVTIRLKLKQSVSHSLKSPGVDQHQIQKQQWDTHPHRWLRQLSGRRPTACEAAQQPEQTVTEEAPVCPRLFCTV